MNVDEIKAMLMISKREEKVRNEDEMKSQRNAIKNVSMIIIEVIILIIIISIMSSLLFICSKASSRNKSSLNSRSLNSSTLNSSSFNRDSLNSSTLNSSSSFNSSSSSGSITDTNNNNNTFADNLLSSLASDAAAGILTELRVNHMGIQSKPTETETEIEQNFLTHNCNKFWSNPKGSGTKNRDKNNKNNRTNSKYNNNNNNNSNNKNGSVYIEQTINRTLVAQINETIKNVRAREGFMGCKSPMPSLNHYKRGNWSKTTPVLESYNEKFQNISRFTALKKFIKPPSAHRRGKRFVIFDGGGVVKFIGGFAIPIILADKTRQVSLIDNFQAQYTPPPRPIYWWSFFNTTTFAARKVRSMQQDASRSFVYTAIESLLDSKGLPGTACLLKAICFVSQQPFHDGNIFHALLNAILTPSVANVDAQYLDAHEAGRNGVDCAGSYKECPNHTDWLYGIKLFY